MSEPARSPVPGALLDRPLAFRIARRGFRLLQRATVPVRRAYYLHGRGPRFARLLPSGLRAMTGLDDESAIGASRLEIGGGPYPQRGFLHVDVDPGAHHLEWVAPAWRLPLPDAWASEISAIHTLEHIEPARLVPTLREWYRVLRSGGRLQVHVPNGPALMAAFVASPVEEKWPIMGSILGVYCGPEVRGPDGLQLRSDHQLVFDAALLRWALEAAGFSDVRDLTGEVDDRHTEAWRPLVADYSLIAEARKPAGSRA